MVACGIQQSIDSLRCFAGKRVVVAMSGGVDSSVAALMMAKAGADAIGVTLKLRDCRDDPGDKACCSSDGISRAASVCATIGMPHYTIDCRDLFEDFVLRPAWEQYGQGRTPNPCLLCNQFIKFGRLAVFAESLSAHAIVTGHYVQTAPDSIGTARVARGLVCSRDQSYFLCRVGDASKLVFPLGGLGKDVVRSAAESAGLVNARARDSQDACFFDPGVCFAEILRQRFGADATPGNIVDDSGTVLARHGGIHLFTPGQRRGLGIGDAVVRWVSEIRAHSGEVVVTRDRTRLFVRRITVTGLVGSFWTKGASGRYMVSVRSGHKPVPATVFRNDDDELSVEFDNPVLVPAPGQGAAFYEGDVLIGGGWIDNVFR